MNKIMAVVAVSIMLLGCSGTPTTADTAQEGARGGAVESVNTQAAANESGLGTIAYDETTSRKPCKKRRKTGSHLYTYDCDGSDSGSRSVKDGTWNNLGRYVVTGTGRPNN